VNAPTNFQQRLGAELTARAEAMPASTQVRVRPRQSRRIAVTAFGLAAAVTAVVLGTQAGSSHTPVQAGPTTSSTTGDNGGSGIENASYTVTVREGGTVALLLTGTKLSGLQTALRRAGLPAVVLTPSASCASRVVGVDGHHLDAVMSRDPKNGRIVLLNPHAVPHGDTVVIVDESLHDGAGNGTVGSMDYILTRNVPSCFPTSQVDIGEGYVP
jgi:hypothetical protein